MIALGDLLTRMQSQATGCVAVLRIDLRDGAVIESCGDEAIAAAAVARIVRELGMPQEVIVLSDDSTYVCGRLADPPHHAVAAICRSTQNLGLIISLLHNGIEAAA